MLVFILPGFTGSTGFFSSTFGSSTFGAAASLLGAGFGYCVATLFCWIFCSKMLVFTFPIGVGLSSVFTGSALTGAALTGSVLAGYDVGTVVLTGAGFRFAWKGLDSAFGESSFLIQEASVFLGMAAGAGFVAVGSA